MSKTPSSTQTTSILPIAARVVVPVQVLFALFLLLRGHNLPGGGFIGGLVLASALVLRVMVDPAKSPRVDLNSVAGIGLLVAMGSAILPLAVGKDFFTGLWGGQLWLPALGVVKIGTPLLFDVGVFIVVSAVATKLLLVLMSLVRKEIH